MMTFVESNKAVWAYLKSKWIIILLFLLVSIFVHIIFFQFTSSDLEIFLLDWFDYYDQVPLKEALQNPISNYTGPYTYFLYLSKLFQRGFESLSGIRIPDIAMIKLINIPFELLTVYLGMLVIRYFKADERSLFYGFALLLFHPVLLINGAFWGQCDIIYASIVLGSFVMLLYKKDIWGIVFFSIAVTIKFQAMFFSPMILALVLSKRLKRYWLAAMPLVYLGLHIPSLIAGRLIWEILTIYLGQASSMPALTGNAPNLYQFIPVTDHLWIEIMKGVGLTITVGIALWLSLRVARRKYPLNPVEFLLLACLSLLLMPFVMPSMLDRYFFPAEMFLLLLALVDLKYWYLPLLVSGASLLVYYNSYNVIALGINAAPSRIAAVMNLVALLVLLRGFLKLKQKEPDPTDQVLQN